MIANIILEHLQELRDGLSGLPTSPAFCERYNVTFDAIVDQRVPKMRTVAAPYYVTDLGVREFSDPKEFYATHTKIAGIAEIDKKIIADCTTQADISELALVLDAEILFFGDYKTLISPIAQRKFEILDSKDYTLLIYCGNILSALNESDAIRFYEAAVDAAHVKSESYAAQHRAAAYEIKRANDPRSGLKRLQQCEQKFIDAGTPEGFVDLALLKNLEALAYSILGKTEESANALIEARDQILKLDRKATQISKEVLSRADRYASQIAINEAQLAISVNNPRKAVQILADNAKMARQQANDYLPEALAELSYGLFLNKQFNESYSVGCEAFWRLQQIGSVKALKTTREILVADLVGMGRVEEAEKLCDQIDIDVLGIQGIGV